MRLKPERGFWLALLIAAAAGVCPAQIPFFSPTNSTAKVVQLQGQVNLLKDARDSYSWALTQGAIVQPLQLIVTGSDGYAKLQVSDGSTFEVYPNSKVIFRNNPGNLKDLVDVVLGRIRVHIEKLGGQPNPNSVKTPSAVISVRGTIFDVVVNEDDATTVAVTEGLVSVRHAVLPGSTEKFLGAGEVLVVHRNEPLAQKGGVNKGAIAARVFRSLQDAVVTILRNPSGGGGGAPTGGAGGGVGDSKGEPPPPPPPPPPPDQN
ncbi:MAG: FecR domain-containing protein [Acidobacteria bacterium]|nr:FecR domain-containing protein [Acidobacteriota bacterium]